MARMFLGDLPVSQRRENEVLALWIQHLEGPVNKALWIVQGHPAGIAHLVPSDGILVTCSVNIYLPVPSTLRRGVLIGREQVQWVESSCQSIIGVCEGLSAI